MSINKRLRGMLCGWALSVLLAGSCAAESLFLFKGRGTVLGRSMVGTPGETVDVSFRYRVSDFPTVSGSNPDASSWAPMRDIPIRAYGSITGEFTNLANLGRVGVAKFRLVQWQFDSEIQGGGLLQSAGLAQADPTQTRVDSPIPQLFAEAHPTLIEEFQGGSVWTSWPDADIATINYTLTNIERLSLGDYQWTVLEIPEPTTVWIALPWAVGATVGRSRRRRCPAGLGSSHCGFELRSSSLRPIL